MSDATHLRPCQARATGAQGHASTNQGTANYKPAEADSLLNVQSMAGVRHPAPEHLDHVHQPKNELGYGNESG